MKLLKVTLILLTGFIGTAGFSQTDARSYFPTFSKSTIEYLESIGALESIIELDKEQAKRDEEDKLRREREDVLKAKKFPRYIVSRKKSSTKKKI